MTKSNKTRKSSKSSRETVYKLSTVASPKPHVKPQICTSVKVTGAEHPLPFAPVPFGSEQCPLSDVDRLCLRRRLCMSIDAYCSEAVKGSKRHGKGQVIDYGADRKTIYYDNGGDVLAVAHLDTVGDTVPVFAHGCVNAMQLDDRLGAWVVMDVLPKMLKGSGVNYDVLLTTDEERCDSTAKDWECPGGKQYRYMIEYDRQGTGSVAYQYQDDPIWCDAIEPYLGKLDVGSYSDIADLSRLGCCGVNIGVGYHLQHSPCCYALLSDTIAQAKRGARMLINLWGSFPYVDRWSAREAEYIVQCRCDGCQKWLYDCADTWMFCPYCGDGLPSGFGY